jgi:O-antigen ligase
MILLCFAIICAMVISYAVDKENIVSQAYMTAADRITAGDSGVWGGRLDQATTAIEEFIRHPIIGSGLATIKADSDNKIAGTTQNMAELARKVDLGYLHWAKAYGLAGALWLVIFLIFLWNLGRSLLPIIQKEDRSIVIFGLSYVSFTIISSLTLNHFMIPARILLICLLTAIFVRLNYNIRKIGHNN